MRLSIIIMMQRVLLCKAQVSCVVKQVLGNKVSASQLVFLLRSMVSTSEWGENNLVVIMPGEKDMHTWCKAQPVFVQSTTKYEAYCLFIIIPPQTPCCKVYMQLQCGLPFHATYMNIVVNRQDWRFTRV